MFIQDEGILNTENTEIYVPIKLAMTHVDLTVSSRTLIVVFRAVHLVQTLLFSSYSNDARSLIFSLKIM